MTGMKVEGVDALSVAIKSGLSPSDRAVLMTLPLAKRTYLAETHLEVAVGDCSHVVVGAGLLAALAALAESGAVTYRIERAPKFMGFFYETRVVGLWHKHIAWPAGSLEEQLSRRFADEERVAQTLVYWLDHDRSNPEKESTRELLLSLAYRGLLTAHRVRHPYLFGWIRLTKEHFRVPEGTHDAILRLRADEGTPELPCDFPDPATADLRQLLWGEIREAFSLRTERSG